MTDTQSIPVDQLSPVKDETRRDRYGRYLVVPPDGGKPVGYTRATTVAGTLDNGGGLAAWKAAMTVVGTLTRKGLRARWEALIAEHQGDPWYAGEQAKKACKALVEECASVGGANDRRDIGTSLHTLTELVDLGRKPTIPDEHRADVNAYTVGLEAAGVKIVAGRVETTVVLDDYRVAGTFDRLVRIPHFDLPLVADLKTGADLSYSWQSISVQLAIYARANAIYHQGPATDGSQDQRFSMPPVDQRNGLVMWLNAGSGRLELFLVDLDLGWDAFEKSMWVRQWRSQKYIGRPYARGAKPATAGDELAGKLEQSLAQAPAVVEGIYQWLAQRIALIGRTEGARDALADRWPRHIPTLKASQSHTAEQLQEIEQILDWVEDTFLMPTTPPRPQATNSYKGEPT